MAKPIQLIEQLQKHLNPPYQFAWHEKEQLLEIITPNFNYINDGITFYGCFNNQQWYLTDGGDQIAEWGMNGFDTHDIHTTFYQHTKLNAKQTKLIRDLAHQFNSDLKLGDELILRIPNQQIQTIINAIQQFTQLCVAVDQQLKIQLQQRY